MPSASIIYAEFCRDKRVDVSGSSWLKATGPSVALCAGAVSLFLFSLTYRLFITVSRLRCRQTAIDICVVAAASSPRVGVTAPPTMTVTWVVRAAAGPDRTGRASSRPTVVDRWPGRCCAKRPFYIGLLWALERLAWRSSQAGRFPAVLCHSSRLTRGNGMPEADERQHDFDVSELLCAITYQRQRLPLALRDNSLLPNTSKRNWKRSFPTPRNTSRRISGASCDFGTVWTYLLTNLKAVRTLLWKSCRCLAAPFINLYANAWFTHSLRDICRKLQEDQRACDYTVILLQRYINSIAEMQKSEETLTVTYGKDSVHIERAH